MHSFCEITQVWHISVCLSVSLSVCLSVCTISKNNRSSKLNLEQIKYMYMKIVSTSSELGMSDQGQGHCETFPNYFNTNARS